MSADEPLLDAFTITRFARKAKVGYARFEGGALVIRLEVLPLEGELRIEGVRAAPAAAWGTKEEREAALVRMGQRGEWCRAAAWLVDRGWLPRDIWSRGWLPSAVFDHPNGGCVSLTVDALAVSLTAETCEGRDAFMITNQVLAEWEARSRP